MSFTFLTNDEDVSFFIDDDQRFTLEIMAHLGMIIGGQLTGDAATYAQVSIRQSGKSISMEVIQLTFTDGLLAHAILSHADPGRTTYFIGVTNEDTRVFRIQNTIIAETLDDEPEFTELDAHSRSALFFP